ncbi:MAG TPA: DUF4255 domain-containing protein [Ideonella sp.]|jgi:hypothetical protein|nr:DUF4255 domain-containing protein [Ideonella sp.]
MLDAVLTFLANEVNRNLARRSPVVEGEGMLPGPVADDRGQWALPVNSLGLTLFQIDEERTLRSQPPERVVLGGREIALPPELKLNATLLVSARFTQYASALRQLSKVLNFFHGRPLFTPADSPGLPEGIDRLAMDLLSYGPEQTNQLWTCLGARHLPSLVYRTRLVLLPEQPPALANGNPALRSSATLGGR